MTTRIHPTALVDASAVLGVDVEIGPWAIVGPGCIVGDGAVLSARATLERDVTLGAGVKVGVGSVLGGDPQDLKYRGEPTRVEIGDGTVLREYSTVNRGTAHSWVTKVGSGCFLMSYVHLAHDCMLGDGVLISNGTQLAGHVVVEDRATISGLCAVHQFVHVGAHAFVGGCSRVAQDVPPYVKAVGNPVKLFGLNSVGLQRSGFAEPVVRELKRAYRLLFRSEHNVSQGLERARAECEALPEVERFLDFVARSERGVGF
jgi:UDP-N-acetylglucosamine acyltransferase